MVKIIFQDAETVGGSEGAAGSASNCFTVSHKFDLLKKKLKMKKRVIFKSNFQSRLCTTHNSSFNSLITSLTLTFKIYLQTNANF